MTARDNLRSAVKDIIDPFNLMTIGADAAFGIATNSHTPYGPGFHGISEYAGVSMTEDLTGEFFGTFLVPSLMHQDPHYHRERSWGPHSDVSDSAQTERAPCRNT